MKFSLALTTLLSVAALASPVAPRAAKKPDNGGIIGQKFEDLKVAVTALNVTLQHFHKGARSVVASYTIRKQALNITSQLHTIVDLNTASSNFSYNNTNAAAGGFLDALDPILDTLLTLRRKRRVVASAVFGFGDLSKTVLQIVTELNDQSKTLAPALVANLDPDTGLPQVAGTFVDSLLQAFNQTIIRYKSCTGQVCLPAIPDSFPV